MNIYSANLINTTLVPRLVIMVLLKSSKNGTGGAPYYTTFNKTWDTTIYRPLVVLRVP
jgi:hypothetical protein